MIYYKIINGRNVFDPCNTIRANDGTWISNPTPEQIAAAGWMEFIPPVVEELPRTDPDIDELMNAVKQMLSATASELSDEDALSVAAVFPTWKSKEGKQVNAGERLWYNEKLYKVVQQHTVQSDWTPDTATSLYTEVSIVEWPDFVQPTGAHDAYMTGDKITYNGSHYVSLIDNNVYSPETYPQGWELVP